MYKSRGVVSNFYGTIFQIWAGFGLVLGRSAILGQLCATFEGSFFMLSWAKKMLFFKKKRCRVRTEKLHNINLREIFKKHLLPLKT